MKDACGDVGRVLADGVPLVGIGESTNDGADFAYVKGKGEGLKLQDRQSA